MRFIEKIPEKEYTNFVINHSMSHFLKSYEWGQASKKRGLIPHYVGLKEGNELVATALLLEKRLPLGYSYYYIPRGYTIDYKNYELISEFTKKIKEYAKKNKAIFFKIDPDIKLHTIDKDAKVIEGNENNYEIVKKLKEIGFKHKKLNLYFENMQPRFTFRLGLDNDISIIRKNYSKSVIRWIKQADKYGVNVKIGTDKDIDEFIHLMKLTEKRQGFFSHNYNFYHDLYSIFNKNKHISLLMATVNVDNLINIIEKELQECEIPEKKIKLEDRVKTYKEYKNQELVVSSYVNIHYGDKSWYLYGANDMTFKDTFANYKLFDYQIEHSKEVGAKLFDEFGTIGDPNSKKSVAGLHEFKKKFGGEYTEFIGEFTYIINPFMYFVFDKLVVLYRKPMKFLRHIKVKLQKR